jgi:hypothetical protein
LRDEWPKRDAHAVGNHNLAVFVEAVDGQPLQVIGTVGSARKPTTALPLGYARSGQSASSAAFALG